MSTNVPFVTGVDFVCVPAGDFAESERFYRETLGLTERARWGTLPAVELQAGNLTLVVIDLTVFGQEQRPSVAPIALQVPDTREARERLEAASVVFRGETIDSGVCHQAYFTDPFGNPLILHHRYAAP